MGSYVASIFAHANSMGSWSSKLILLNLKYFIKIQSKTYFCSSKNWSDAHSQSIDVLLSQKLEFNLVL